MKLDNSELLEVNKSIVKTLELIQQSMEKMQKQIDTLSVKSKVLGIGVHNLKTGKWKTKWAE